jgi:tetratricopeptide (TPR) repeat protein
MCAAQAGAQATSDDLARSHFDSAAAYLQESDYENALKAFQKAYELSKRPEILLNIATVHERLSDLPSAVAALKGYLEAAPQGEHAETVKLRVQNLERRIQEHDAAKSPPVPSPAPAAAPVSAPEPAKVPAPPPPKRPSRRLPAFIALGVGGVMAGGSLATGLIAKSKYDDAELSCQASCDDNLVSSSRTFAITSTVLTGAAVLGVGLGLALLFTAEGDADLAGPTPRLDVTVGPKAAAAAAAWSF